MPVNMEFVHPIIDAFLKARQQGLARRELEQQEEQASLDREEKQRQFDIQQKEIGRRFDEQLKQAKEREAARMKLLQAEHNMKLAETRIAVKKALESGVISGKPTANRPSDFLDQLVGGNFAEATGDVEYEDPNIPGGPITGINPLAAAQRQGAILEASKYAPQLGYQEKLLKLQQPFKMEQIDAQLEGQLEREQVRMKAYELLEASKQKGRESLEAQRQRNRVALKNMAGPDGGEKDKPITLEQAATYGLPVGTKVSELRGEILRKPLTSQEEAKLAAYTDMAGILSDLKSLAEETKYAAFTPIIGNVKSGMENVLKTETPKMAALRAKRGELQARIAKERGGTAFTPNEQKLLETYVPILTDSPVRAATKIAEGLSHAQKNMQNLLRPASRRSAPGPSDDIEFFDEGTKTWQKYGSTGKK